MNRDILSLEQECALQQFENGDNLIVTGPAGTGKTKLIQYFLESAKERKKNIQVCAMTGCAALLLTGCNASTIHSWSGIRTANKDVNTIITSVLENKTAIQKWRKVNILIIDEVSMMSEKIFDLLNELGKHTRQKTEEFGGIQVVFMGDFYQLPPVGREERFCFESAFWYKVFDLDNHIVLQTIFRQRDPIHQSILSSIRCGEMERTQIEFLQKYVNRVYDIESHGGCVPMKLFPTRQKVDSVNQSMFQQLEGPSYEYNYIQKSNCITYLESGTPIPTEKAKKTITTKQKEYEMDSLLKNSPAEQKLHLKKGTNVMCTVNLDLDIGICNGSIGVVIDFQPNVTGIPIPIVRFSNGIVKQIPIKYWQSEEFPVLAIGQIPLCYAWAITIHKIQGATLSLAEIDIGHNIFEYGQSYVALSRMKDLDGLYLSGFSPSKIKVHPKVKAFYCAIPKVEYEIET